MQSRHCPPLYPTVSQHKTGAKTMRKRLRKYKIRLHTEHCCANMPKCFVFGRRTHKVAMTRKEHVSRIAESNKWRKHLTSERCAPEVLQEWNRRCTLAKDKNKMKALVLYSATPPQTWLTQPTSHPHHCPTTSIPPNNPTRTTQQLNPFKALNWTTRVKCWTSS